jgi:hypothetical protein
MVMDVGMYAIKVTEEIIQFLWYMRPDHKYVAHVTEPACRLVGCPAE